MKYSKAKIYISYSSELREGKKKGIEESEEEWFVPFSFFIIYDILSISLYTIEIFYIYWLGREGIVAGTDWKAQGKEWFIVIGL
jgi:hypothetical protein